MGEFLVFNFKFLVVGNCSFEGIGFRVQGIAGSLAWARLRRGEGGRDNYRLRASGFHRFLTFV